MKAKTTEIIITPIRILTQAEVDALLRPVIEFDDEDQYSVSDFTHYKALEARKAGL